MLNVLEGYDFSKIPYGSPQHVHLLVEAKKLAFADRARWYADPAFQPAPVDKLISKPYADARRKLISADKVLREVQPGTPAELQEGDTIYLTTADADGMMGSLIQSNYRGTVSYTHLDVYKRQGHGWPGFAEAAGDVGRLPDTFAKLYQRGIL